MSKKKPPASGRSFEALRTLRDAMSARPKPTPQRQEKPAPAHSASRPPEDEAQLFHRLYAGVQPIDRTRGRIPKQRLEPSETARRASSRGPAVAVAEDEAVRDRLRTLTDGIDRFEVSDDGERSEGRRLDVPLETLRGLRRGRMPIDARIDLHGMTAEQARAELEFFLRTMRARGERCVLVIHGKGAHSPTGVGILRGEISAWLSQGASSASVSAFATARQEDGGLGAVYVLLRR
jgi:DNA-nicking Smr family endonuclease